MYHEEASAREHIRHTMSRYCMAVDSSDFANFAPNFTDDILFLTPVFSCDGRAELEKFYAERFEPENHAKRGFRRHNLTTCQIDFTSATTANTKAYYYVISSIGPDHCGFYKDRFRRGGDRWLIAYREVWVDWSAPDGVCSPDVIKRMIAEKRDLRPGDGYGGDGSCVNRPPPARCRFRI